MMTRAQERLTTTVNTPRGPTAAAPNPAAPAVKNAVAPAAALAAKEAPRDGFRAAAGQTPGERVRATLQGAPLARAAAPTPAPSQTPAHPDSDPMTHIAYLSSDALQGRDSPSTGLDAASAYVQQLAQKYGLEGPNTANPSNPFQQRFPVFSFVGEGAGRAAAVGHEAHPEFGHELFQEGFYLDDAMPRDTRELLTQKYEATQSAAGKKLAPRTEPLSVDELRRVAKQDGKAENTLALLKGSGPHKDEVIVVMAHLDHIGTQGGQVNNGADDNASGSAVLLSAMPELAEAAKNGKLDRSVLFLWTGGEEKGLVGSQYFVDHPIPGLGLDKISGVVNMDMVGRWDDQRLSVIDTNSRGKANYFRDAEPSPHFLAKIFSGSRRLQRAASRARPSHGVAPRAAPSGAQ